jgi:hypothetical protein
MTPENSSRRYTNEQANAILQRALERQGKSGAGTLTHEDLMETARELGIDPSQIEAAMMEQERDGEIDAAKVAWRAQRKRKFFEHLRSYLIVNAFLFLLNAMTGESMWFIWPLLGWGIGIAFDAAEAFFPKDRSIERGARRLLEREKRLRRIDREVKQKMKPSKSVTIDSKGGRIIIEKGDKRIEIG